MDNAVAVYAAMLFNTIGPIVLYGSHVCIIAFNETAQCLCDVRFRQVVIQLFTRFPFLIYALVSIFDPVPDGSTMRIFNRHSVARGGAAYCFKVLIIISCFPAGARKRYRSFNGK